MGWGKKKIQGVTYDLGHLDSFVLEAPSKSEPGRVYRVSVEFGSHTFTKKWDSSVHTPDFQIRDGSETRCFCPDRFLLSKLLPGIVQAACNARAYISERDNFLLVEDIEGADAPYVVYFDAIKARAKKLDVVMAIRSAHPRPNLPEMLPVVTFPTLIELASKGKKPNPGRPVFRKRK